MKWKLNGSVANAIGLKNKSNPEVGGEGWREGKVRNMKEKCEEKKEQEKKKDC